MSNNTSNTRKMNLSQTDTTTALLGLVGQIGIVAVGVLYFTDALGFESAVILMLLWVPLACRR